MLRLHKACPGWSFSQKWCIKIRKMLWGTLKNQDLFPQHSPADKPTQTQHTVRILNFVMLLSNNYVNIQLQGWISDTWRTSDSFPVPFTESILMGSTVLFSVYTHTQPPLPKTNLPSLRLPFLSAMYGLQNPAGLYEFCNQRMRNTEVVHF